MPVDEPVAEGVAAWQGEADPAGSGEQAGGQDGSGADTPAQLVRDGGVPGSGRRGLEAVADDPGRGASTGEDLRADLGVQDVRDAGQGQRFVGQQGAGVQVEGDVLAALDRCRALQTVAAGDADGAGDSEGL
ncbi:hypothetical protein SSAG_01085 [Streptomyces sp. Mg1]|nr:hypothetical protein SSAG_01085 [Streptomyces sp. Mg1]